MTRRTQWLRHGVRALVLLGAIALATLAGYRSLHAGDPGPGGVDPKLLRVVRGNSWSVEIGPLSLTDPLGGLESLFAGKVLVSALVVGLALPIVATMLAGKLFCSWICPAGFLLELADRLRRLAPGRSRRNHIGFWRGNKYVLLGVGLSFSAAVATPILVYIYPPAVLMRELHQWTYSWFADRSTWNLVAAGTTWGLTFLFLIVAFELFVSRRMWCRYFCPGGALYGLLGALRIWRVSPPDAACDRCGECVAACPLGLNPMQSRTGIECDNCFACVGSCPVDALHLRFRALSATR